MLTLEEKFRLRAKQGALIAAIVAVLVLLGRPLICKPEPNIWAGEGYNYSASDKPNGQRFSYTIRQKEANSQKDNSQSGDRDYLKSFCEQEIKLTDVALVYFTYILALVGLYQMRSTDDTARRAERAYLFGGGPFGAKKLEHVKELQEGTVFNDSRYYTDEKRLTIFNYGRTAGFVIRVEYGFCDELPEGKRVSEAMDDGPLQPYCIAANPGNVYPAAGSGGPGFYLYRHVSFKRSDHEGKIFFGRIWYKDVFHKKHFSTFSLRLRRDAGVSDPIGDSYTDDWD